MRCRIDLEAYEMVFPAVDGAMNVLYLCATKTVATEECPLTRNLAQVFLHCLIHGKTPHITKWARASLKVCCSDPSVSLHVDKCFEI